MHSSGWLFLLPDFFFFTLCLFMTMLAYYSPVTRSCPCGVVGQHRSLCMCVVKLNREMIILFQLNEFCDIAIVEISQ